MQGVYQPDALCYAMAVAIHIAMQLICERFDMQLAKTSEIEIELLSSSHTKYQVHR